MSLISLTFCTGRREGTGKYKILSTYYMPGIVLSILQILNAMSFGILGIWKIRAYMAFDWPSHCEQRVE